MTRWKGNSIAFYSAMFVAAASATRAGAVETVAEEVTEAQRKRIATIANASRATISVFNPGGGGGGSGVVISSDGYALSNFHVVSPAGNHMRCSMPDGQLYDAVIVGIDPTGDVALIKMIGRDDFPHAIFGDSDQVRAGQWCFAVGNPFLLATDFQPTVTQGIISGVHRYQYPAGTLLEYTDCIQTDTSVNPGNSGGPLFNQAGELIGINGRCSFEKRGRVNVGVAYAISINQIKNFLGYLHSGRIVDHATLGATVSSDSSGRVIVSNILRTSDAYRRGLRIDDEIVSFGRRPIGSVNEFKNVLGIFPRGWRIPLSYRRDGERHEIYVRLSGVHSTEELIRRIQTNRESPTPPDPPPDGEERPRPRRRDRNPMRAGSKKTAMPDHVAKQFESRRGYSNYYFNRLNRNRVWSQNRKNADLLGWRQEWVMEGELAGGGAVRFIMRDEDVFATFPDASFHVDLTRNLNDQLVPEDSGGLLIALAMWRRLMVMGPERFGEVFYLGTGPVIHREGVADVLVATYDVVESRFYFDTGNGQLISMEMFPDTHVDPCEIDFLDYHLVDGRQLPRRLIVRFGDTTFAQLRPRRFHFGQKKEGELQ